MAMADANSNRYAADLVIVDEQRRMYHDDPYNKKNWYTYGALIYAPGDGNVLAIANNIPDLARRLSAPCAITSASGLSSITLLTFGPLW